ncbi:hypothetical protein D3C75_474840 [compost metagenome]
MSYVCFQRTNRTELLLVRKMLEGTLNAADLNGISEAGGRPMSLNVADALRGDTRISQGPNN